MAKRSWWSRQQEEAPATAQHEAERREEQREEQIDRTGAVPGERHEADGELLAERIEAQARVDADQVGLGDRDPGSLDTGASQLGLEEREIEGGLDHQADLEVGSPGGQTQFDDDPMSLVSDGYRTPLDDVMDEIEAEEAAADAGTADADGGTGDEGVSGAGYQVPGTTYSEEEGFQGGPSRGSDSSFLNTLSEWISFGPSGSTHREQLDGAMDEIDATSGGTGGGDEPADATPAPPGQGGQEEEDDEGGGFFDWLFGDDDEEESQDQGTGTGAPTGQQGGGTEGGSDDDSDDNSDDGSDDNSDDGTDDDGTDDNSDDGTDDDGTDDAPADDGTEADGAGDPPPDEQHDPESQAPPPTQAQLDAAEAEMVARQSWDVTPGWDDPGGDGPSDDSIQMESRPTVDPYETVDGKRRTFDDVPEDAEDRLTAGMGDLVRPGDDDPDGVWGGNDPGGEPDDPFGGVDPAAAVDAAPEMAPAAPIAETAGVVATGVEWTEEAPAADGGAQEMAAPVAEAVATVDAAAPMAGAASMTGEAAAPAGETAPAEPAAMTEAVLMEGAASVEEANAPADVETIAMGQAEPIVQAEPMEMMTMDLAATAAEDDEVEG